MNNEGVMRRELQKLRTEINDFEIPDLLREAGLENYNICLFGEKGNGKSSLVNSFCTSLNEGTNHVEKAATGISDTSLTKRLTKYDLVSKGNITIWDVWGWQKETYAELPSLSKGYLQSNFEKGSKQDNTNSRFRKKDDINSQVHCFIHVIDACSADDNDKVITFKKFLEEIKNELGNSYLDPFILNLS